jgi:hypothetical protein
LFEQRSNGLRRGESNPDVCLFYRNGFVSVLGWLLGYSVQQEVLLASQVGWSLLQALLGPLLSVEFQVNLSINMNIHNVKEFSLH